MATPESRQDWILKEARKRPATERSAFLDGACAGDAALRQRAENRIIPVPLKQVNFPEDRPQTFQLTDPEGKSHRIPFHRVREVYKDSQRIWHRGEASAYS